MTDRMLAVVLLLLRPLVYSLRRPMSPPAGAYLGVLFGRRRLVDGVRTVADTQSEPGAGKRQNGNAGPLFTAASLFGATQLDGEEREEVLGYYRTHSSFLLDCEIVIASLRDVGRSGEQPEGSASESLREGAGRL